MSSIIELMTKVIRPKTVAKTKKKDAGFVVGHTLPEKLPRTTVTFFKTGVVSKRASEIVSKVKSIEAKSKAAKG